MRARNLGPVFNGSPASAAGVLITGVYGAGKSSVAAEIAYLLAERRCPYAFLDVDFLGLEDLVVANDRPIGVVATEIMSWLGWA